MANEELVALLKQGAQAWNAWRAEHREAPVDLSGAALRGLDLSGADLAKADLRRAVGLTRAQLKNAACDVETRLPKGLGKAAGHGE